MITPEPLFPCSEPGCADEISYYASDLQVYKGKLYCCNCWDNNDPVYVDDEDDSATIGWNELKPFIPPWEARIEELEQQLATIRIITDKQAEDVMLWCKPQHIVEDSLQRALRGLHEIIEGVTLLSEERKGMVLVPLEATPRQLLAGYMAVDWNKLRFAGDTKDLFQPIYKAMISAE